MLYRKYRPQKFSQLVGLETVKKTLVNQVKSGQIGHAYLFAGPRGTGKTTTARILSKTVNCEKPKAGEPCGTCSNCQQIQESRFVDLIEIDAASNRGIDDIRALRDRVRLAPAHGKFKVYIIDEAHMLTPEAFNALLKTLEEPPAHAIFILATTEPHKLPDTIRSRCQRFSFERAPVSQIVEKLEEIVKSEKLKISDVQLEQIAKAAGGGFRDAETLLEQVATGGEEVDKLIGFAKLGELADFLDHLIKKDASQAIFFINNLYNNGVDMSTLAIAILEYLRDLLLIQAGVGDELVDVGREQYEVMKKQAGGLSTRRLEYMINKITQAYEFLSQAAIPTLPLEVAVVELTSEESSADRLPQPEVKAAPAEKKAPPAATSAPPAESDEWSRLMTAVKPLNHSVEALLRSCRLGGVTARAITIQALYDFHKEKLEDAKSQKILSQAIQEVFGKPLKIKVELSGNK